MKFWKKTTALLVCLSMSISLCACDSNGDKNNSNQWGNSTPTPITPIVPGGGSSEGQGEKYLNGIVNTLKNAQTITVHIEYETIENSKDLDYGIQNDDWYDDYDDSYNDYDTFEANVTMTKAGDYYNLMIIGTESGRYEETNGDYGYSYDNVVQAYIIDEYRYEYNDFSQQWVKYPMDWEKMLEFDDDDVENIILGQLYNALMTGDLSVITAILGPILDQTLHVDVQNNTYQFNLDAAAEIQKAKDLINNTDYNQPAESFVNTFLADNGYATTVENILEEVDMRGGNTLSQVFDEIDNDFKRQTGMGLDEIKDKLIAQINYTLLAKACGEYAGDVFEVIDTLKEISVKNVFFSYLSEYLSYDFNLEIAKDVLPNYTINDLLVDILGENNEGVNEDLDVCTDSLLNALREMTLEEFIRETCGNYFFENELWEINEYTFRTFEEKLAIKFDGYKMNNLQYDVQANYNWTDEDWRDDCIYNLHLTVQMSKTPTEIKAPENAVDSNSFDY